MAKIKLRFTEEELALISAIHSGLIKVEHHKSTIGRDVNEIVKAFGLDNPDLDDNDLLMLREKMEKLGEVAKKSATEAQMDAERYYGVDTYDMFNGTDWQTAIRLVYQDAASMDDIDIEYKADQIAEKIVSNIEHIEQLVHQMCNKGGLKPGVTYTCIDRVGIWSAEEDTK